MSLKTIITINRKQKKGQKEDREGEMNRRKRTKKTIGIKAKWHAYSFLKANVYTERFSIKSAGRKVVFIFSRMISR